MDYGELRLDDRLKLKDQIRSVLEPRQKIDGFLLDEGDWSPDDDRLYRLPIYDSKGFNTIGFVNVYAYELTFKPTEGEEAEKRWSSTYDNKAMTNEPSGTPLDLAKPSVAFLLAEIKKAKKSLAKRR